MQAKLTLPDEIRNMNTDDIQEVVCTLNGATVTVRQSTDGSCMVVAIDGKVSMEPRKAAIWLVVKP